MSSLIVSTGMVCHDSGIKVRDNCRMMIARKSLEQAEHICLR